MTDWDARFMRIAEEVGSWSKDPGTKVGAVLVYDRRIISQGYNGFPKGVLDLQSRYENRDTKLSLTVHAEVNAILNAAKNGASTDGSTLYTTFAPCVHCSTAVVQAGIARVVAPNFQFAPERWRTNFAMGNDVLREAGIEVVHYTPEDYDS